MERRDLIRRTALLCIYVARNICYYRSGWRDGQPVFPKNSLWVTLNNNFLDIAVLEWCKLFGDDSGVHSWRKAVSSPDSFRAGLLTELSFSPVEWDDYIGEQRTYRNKFVAHLDKLPVMNIPDLTASLTSVTALHSTLRREDCASYLQDLDRDLAAYQTVLSSEGDALYQLAQE